MLCEPEEEADHLNHNRYPQTLLNWLLRDLLTISQIDCLVFDHDDDPEGDRPSLRIVSEFYAVAPTADRPRVLSLVYPPRLLDSFLRDLRTAENASFCVHCGPQDLVHFYEPNPPLRVTRVFRQLQHHDYDSGLLTEPFAVAKDL